MIDKNKLTKKGLRHIIYCGENVERVEVSIIKKKTAFKKQEIDKEVWTKGSKPLRIILEDNQMWDK